MKTAYGTIRTQRDGIRVYITENRQVGSRFLELGWALHPAYSEAWARQTGTYIFVVPADWRIFSAEPIAALPPDEYKEWKRAVLDAWEAAKPTLAQKRAFRAMQREAMQHVERNLKHRYKYKNEKRERGEGITWVDATDISTWEMEYPKNMKAETLDWSSPDFSQYVHSGAVREYNRNGNAIERKWWQEPSIEAFYDGMTADFELPIIAAISGSNAYNTMTIAEVEGAVDAEVVFPSLATAFTVGDGKRDETHRKGRVEAMLRWIGVVYGARAAVRAEEWLCNHCPAFTAPCETFTPANAA